MDKEEARNELEKLFVDVFEDDPISRQLQKIDKLCTYGWDNDIALEYIEDLKKKLK